MTFRKKYILCVLKLAAVSASHCTLVIKAILTNLFTKTLYISNIELYLALGTKTIHPVKYNILFSPNQA
ncbi:hypothetical protein GJO35_10320 [Campylobacter jejuni]|nr:hypothetical protein [Campylobacter jejuni]EDP5577722.1 hypothetical protein [Campylobacter jejuni]